ncbi:family 2 glycoside hydrolase [Melampsora larici-populina 98AG31]|uniref:Family 2 glycoside hydrolase n=1 Tax=Melampsora larici-populina (strain 98AG31 / pathotype 3-4-7) TaxID=747676 RepID=F4RTJ8_MELLP|nr:family 2 glycoside hydrolase [Melampsora larici-populina 98AG31]EGG04268.1 family 2 glycoside hydrolase [Melampsora larici-populina 98AG31]
MIFLTFFGLVLQCSASTLPSTVTPYALKSGPLDTDWTTKVGTNPWPEYPRPQLQRSNWLNLNGLWEFKSANSTLDLDSPPFGGVGFDKEILVPFCVESALSGIMEAHDHFWYRKTFKVPSTWKGKVLLNFGAVDYEATVFLNKQKIGFHRGGYFKFSIDLSKYLHPTGEENELLVFIYDPTDSSGSVIPVGKQTQKPSHVFYTSTSGIWQTVFLEPVPETYITKLDVNADMHGHVNITVKTSDPTSRTPIKVTLHQQTNSINSNSSISSPTLMTINGTSNTKFQFQVSSPKLWSPSTPNLYYFTVEMGDDLVTSYLGFRSIEKRTDPNGIVRPYLNGEFLFQLGPLDQGFWPDGIYTAPTVEAMEYDIKLVKSLGFNLIRKHVKVEPDLYYHACDRIGLLVWQDMPSLNLFPSPSVEQSAEFERQLYDMVSALISVPSIITWVIFNEGWGQPSDGPEVRLTEQIRLLDSDRLVMSVTGYYDHGAGDYSDNHHYASPQCGTPFYSTPDKPYDPKRIGSQGEFGGIGHIPPSKNTWNVQDAINTMNQTYEITSNVTTWNYRALEVVGELKSQLDLYSCSAGVYTQTTDVEGEINGFVTYDRRLVRADPKQWNAITNSFYETAKAKATKTSKTSKTSP